MAGCAKPIVLQQVTLLRDSSQFTSNLYKKMGALCALISVRNGLESISEHLDPKSFRGPRRPPDPQPFGRSPSFQVFSLLPLPSLRNITMVMWSNIVLHTFNLPNLPNISSVFQQKGTLFYKFFHEHELQKIVALTWRVGHTSIMLFGVPRQ